ncbi:crotonobetainyl-CoA hydratase [Rhizobiales bacterium GAS188]|nr:crotonobetainyl-CoA hydratase [Rhizobiales bacterium GAS188]
MGIDFTRDGAVATFRIDNGKVNVLTPAMHKELFEALGEFIADPALRVGVLSGSEGKSFCAGDDIKMPLPELTSREAFEAHLFPHAHEAEKGLTRPGWEQDVMRLKRYKPIVGAVDRYCLGQGLVYLLLLTDIRLATPRAEFGFPEIAYGMGGAGGLTRLGAQVPHTVAMELLLLGERIDAARALSAHLINRVVPPERLLSEAMAMAGRIAQHPPIAVRVEMETYARAMEMTREQAADYTGTLFRFQRTVLAGEGVPRSSFGDRSAVGA